MYLDVLYTDGRLTGNTSQMEWLLLLLLGSLAAGTVYWTASSRPDQGGKEPDGEGPRSSPELPERRERGPVIDVKASDIDRFREFLSKVPEPVRPEVVETQERTAKEAANDLRKELRRKKKPLKVTYNTDQIIARSSPHAFHRRPLQSAEQFVEQQLAEEALHLFERVDKRVQNEEINRKIRVNIEDIRRWIEGLDADEDEPITFPEIIIPLTTQALALESLSEGLRRISEILSHDIASAMRQQGSIRADLHPGTPLPAAPASPPQRHPQTGAESPPGQGAPGPYPSTGPAAYSGPAAPAQPAPPAGRRIYVAPPPLPIPGDPAAGVPGVTVYPQVAPVGPSVTTGPADFFRHAREEFKFDEQGRLVTDGRTDEDFERDWEKYRMLPLTDRRGGDPRRRPEDEDDDRIDRRSREDRRRNDRFLERDEFLESWKHHDERKQLLEQRGITPIPGADIIVAPYPYGGGMDPFGYTDPIGLPQADEHLLDKALQEADSLLDQIHTEVHVGGGALPEELSALELPDPRTEAESPNYTEMPPGGMASRVELVEPPVSALNLPDPESIGGAPTDYDDSRAESDERKPEGTPDKPEPPDIDAEATAQEDESFGEGVEAADIPDMPEVPEERGPVQEIRGVLELKPPDEDDAPFLTLTYDFTKIPDSFKLSRDYHTMEFVYYKYKPMLIKAQEFARRKMLKSALNYYRVIKSQNIPPEFRRMVNRNIQDITDYLEKFMMSRSGD